MASVNTQKTDPVMEPKLKAVDWDKVSRHGTGQGGDWGSWGWAGAYWPWLFTMRGMRAPGAGAGSS